jgi:hypothetical protein
MKRFAIATVCLLLVLPTLSLAAPPDSTSATRANSLRAGAWALQFDVNGELIRISSFSGGVSLKRQFSAKSAWRFGVGFNGSNRDGTQDPSLGAETALSDDGYGVSIESVYQRYLNPDARVNAYWGLGPTASFNQLTSASERDSTSYSSKWDSWSVGVIAAFGVEWFAAKEISLHAEFTGRASYFNDERTSEQKAVGFPATSQTTKIDGWSVGTNDGVRFGMSIYF